VANAQLYYYNGSDGKSEYEVNELGGGFVFIDGEGIVVNFNAVSQGDIFLGSESPGATLNFGTKAAANLIHAMPGSYLNLYGGSVGFLVSVDPGAIVKIYGERFILSDGTECYPGTTLSVVGSTVVTAFDADDIQLFRGRISFSPGASVFLSRKAEDLGLEVKIDVKPDSHPSIINLRSNGVLPVAVLSDDSFDATRILPGTVDFAGAAVTVCGKGKYMAHREDVNGDGRSDMLFHFKTNDLKLEAGVIQTTVTLTGQLRGPTAAMSAGKINDGILISGTENVYILRRNKK
jgi:hypothetical protein